jgi:hypothetical protein
VWTPKRIVLLVLGFTLFVAAYWGYAHFLGGIDGLPALPEEYLRSEQGPEGPVEPSGRSSELDAKLRQAFGEECPELDHAIKLEVRAKGMLLAAKDYQILDDGRIRLSPLSVAMFGKNTGDGKFPEINTLRCREAFLTFDHPITSPADMGRYKITLAQLQGQVEVVNNRRTPERDDDLNVFTQGPVFYKEDEHRVWTEKPVEMKDLQSKPDPMVITGTGLDLYLSAEDANPSGAHVGKHGGAGHKGRQASVSGVERVVLHQDVEMHLYPDGDSGFLSGNKDKGKAGTAADRAAGPSAKRAHVVIKTQGPFVFDVPHSHARFDVSEHPGPYPNRVQATRIQELDKCDELDCEHLELQFQQKDENSPKTTVREDRSLDLEIQTAHATGKEVTLKSDSENMDAAGDDFFYDARTRQSTLKRSGPSLVWAMQNGNEIHAREIRIVEQKGAQQVTALGPGWIDLLDTKNGSRGQHAEWKDQLVSGRDGPYDLLVLTVDAAFEDRVNKQRLQADVLKVWLEPAPPKDGPAEGTKAPADGTSHRGADAGEQHGRRPHHLEAVGHVLAKSPDLNIHDTEHLVIWFQDAPPPGADGAVAQAAPAAAGDAAAAKPAAGGPPAATTPAVATGGPPVAKTAPTAAPGKPAENDKPPRPIDLSARLVEAHVLRGEAKNELDRLWTEGDVKVRQAPANPGDKGVDIHGDTLKMTRQQAGCNLLVVTGDLARLLMDKIYIVGPVVNIDQQLNKVWVNGIGAMQMDSDSDFQGKKLKEPVPLTVHWSQSMLFEGNRAEFHGGKKGNVLAEQQNSRVLCQSMYVSLDRSVSLREGQREAPPAKIKNMTCDQKVIVEDIDRDDKGQLVKYQRLECPDLDVDNEAGEARASGPGVVRILQYGDAGDPLASPGGTAPPGAAARPANGKPPELQLTRVNYAGQMYANNKNHTAIFTQDVDTVHVPSEDILAQPNVDHLPEGGLAMRCDKLTVYTRPEANSRSSQQMVADGRCSFKTPDSWGQSDHITFDESKDQVIFIGGPGRPAQLFRQRRAGDTPQKITAQKIIYLRKTGEFFSDQTQGVESH